MPYARDLWWEFAFESNAPRWLRASVVAVLITAGFAPLAAGRAQLELATGEASAEEMDRAAICVASSRDTVASLALLGDKQLLFSEAGDAFIMFQRSGRSIVALGDPGRQSRVLHPAGLAFPRALRPQRRLAGVL